MPSSEAGRSSVVAIVEVCLMDGAESPDRGMNWMEAPSPALTSRTERPPGLARREPCRPGALRARAPRLPERFRSGIGSPSEDEEQVRKPVQVGDHERVDVDAVGGVEDVALGPPAGCSGDVEPRRELAPAGEDEALELRQVGVEPVAVRLERVDLRLRYSQPVRDPERHADVGADVEELVLHTLEHGGHLRGRLRREREAQERVDLVDRAESGDTAVELRHPAPVAEARLPSVAGPRVDAGQADRLVLGTRHDRELRRRGGTLRARATDRARTPP